MQDMFKIGNESSMPNLEHIIIYGISMYYKGNQPLEGFLNKPPKYNRTFQKTTKVLTVRLQNKRRTPPFLLSSFRGLLPLLKKLKHPPFPLDYLPLFNNTKKTTFVSFELSITKEKKKENPTASPTYPLLQTHVANL